MSSKFKLQLLIKNVYGLMYHFKLLITKFDFKPLVEKIIVILE